MADYVAKFGKREEVDEKYPLDWDNQMEHPHKKIPTVADYIQGKCNDIAEMLIAKNRAYGNSALDPVSYLSTADALERLAVRIDDKINRLQQGQEYPGDDTIVDLAGYLVLYLIARQDNG